MRVYVRVPETVPRAVPRERFCFAGPNHLYLADGGGVLEVMESYHALGVFFFSFFPFTRFALLLYFPPTDSRNSDPGVHIAEALLPPPPFLLWFSPCFFVAETNFSHFFYLRLPSIFFAVDFRCVYAVCDGHLRHTPRTPLSSTGSVSTN